ncbi:MAG TPA: protein translocase subunit SecF [Gemmatimonadales bacterium]|nr:protein translocase subunit SecF [Gemmatimonadales bacterium]
MIRFFANANYDFISYRKVAYAVTAAVAIPGLILLGFRGLNYSIEFTGGTLVQVTAQRPEVSIGGVRSALERGGLRGAEITTFGANNVFVVRAHLAETEASVQEDEAQATAARVTAALEAAYGEGSFRLDRREAVGPKVGGELRTKALLAILMSFGAVLVYLAFRFEWRFGLAAVLATAHDILTTLAFISYMDLEVSLVVVSAILTVVGYSLNDTIIIFDRTRENLKKYRREDLAAVLNRSINETLPRSILTHATTLAAISALLVFSGEVIRPFAWVMGFGVFTGTFSSIYIAAPLLMAIEQRWPGRNVRGVKALVQSADSGPATA